MKERARRFAQFRKGVWKRPGDHRGDAEPDQQGEDAEKHRGENAGRGPHG
jgi:hypothetical protein